MTEHNAGHRDYVTCPNRRCLDGGYPWWDSDDKEVECPTCHGEGVVLAETTSSTLVSLVAQAVVEVEPFGSVSGGRVAAAVLDAIEAAGYAIVRRSAERPTSCDPLGGHVPNCTCAEDNDHPGECGGPLDDEGFCPHGVPAGVGCSGTNTPHRSDVER